MVPGLWMQALTVIESMCPGFICITSFISNLPPLFSIIQLSFIVVNSAGTAPTVQVYSMFQGGMHYRFITKIVTAASGIYSPPTEKFELSWPLTAASSYTFQPGK